MPTAQRTEILSTYDQAIEEGRQETLEEVVVRCRNNKLDLGLIASITNQTVDQVKAILVAKQLI